jgi:hypothetical protein
VRARAASRLRAVVAPATRGNLRRVHGYSGSSSHLYQSIRAAHLLHERSEDMLAAFTASTSLAAVHGDSPIWAATEPSSWPTGEQHYEYTPHAVVDQNGTRRTWYCSNRDSGVIRDVIMMRTDAADSDGYNAASLALAPGNATDWDGRHVCDPHVVRSELPFNLHAQSFQFAMLYTGTLDPTGKGLGNSVGVAVSSALDGPWIKKPNGPLISGTGGWGAGQPSATSINGSTLMLFFTRGDSNAGRA